MRRQCATTDKYLEAQWLAYSLVSVGVVVVVRSTSLAVRIRRVHTKLYDSPSQGVVVLWQGRRQKGKLLQNCEKV